MFESASLGRSYSSKEYSALKEELRGRLFAAQRGARERNVPVLVIIEGVDGVGKDAVVNLLSEWMDAKNIRTHTFWLETDEEKKRPEAWRYWRALPGKGEMAVFFGGWYSEPIRKLCCGGLNEDDFNRRMQLWARLERSLAASGTLIVKFWLHISKKAHKERLEERLKHKNRRSFTPYDKKSEENYDGLVSAAGKAITITDRAYAPWTLIDAFDANFRNVAVTRALTAALDSAVAARDLSAQASSAAPGQTSPADGAGAERGDAAAFSALDAVDLSGAREHSEYKKKLAALQEDVRALTYKAWKAGISSTLVFEGWDAAGKGGAIRRLTAGMDARIARVIPISAPTDEELAHHYLWRFWRHVPMAGFVTVYDRSCTAGCWWNGWRASLRPPTGNGPMPRSTILRPSCGLPAMWWSNTGCISRRRSSCGVSGSGKTPLGNSTRSRTKTGATGKSSRLTWKRRKKYSPAPARKTRPGISYRPRTRNTPGLRWCASTGIR